MALSKEQILAAGAREVVTVAVPGWGGDVCLRPLSGADMSAIYARKFEGSGNMEAMVALSLCDPDGTRLFAIEDAPKIFDKANASLEPLIEKVLEINRMTKGAVDEARKT